MLKSGWFYKFYSYGAHLLWVFWVRSQKITKKNIKLKTQTKKLQHQRNFRDEDESVVTEGNVILFCSGNCFNPENITVARSGSHYRVKHEKWSNCGTKNPARNAKKDYETFDRHLALVEFFVPENKHNLKKVSFMLPGFVLQLAGSIHQSIPMNHFRVASLWDVILSCEITSQRKLVKACHSYLFRLFFLFPERKPRSQAAVTVNVFVFALPLVSYFPFNDNK